jgi:hypothetical protein
LVREFREQLRDKDHRFLPHPSVVRVWRAFYDLHPRRQSGMSPCPIAWSDLVSYLALTGETLELWEIDGLFALDDAWLSYEPPKAEDGAPMLKATPKNIKDVFSLFKGPSRTGEKETEEPK